MPLEINNLSVGIGNKTIIKKASMRIDEEEVVLLLGPNGSGKSTLIQAIMGNPKFQVKNGSIIYNGEDITSLPMHERVIKGIVSSHQIPPSIRGITLYNLAYNILKKRGVNGKKARDLIYEYASSLNLLDFLDRNVNLGFSGGELKRSELFLALLSRPRIMLLDEIDSGVDIENIRIMAKEIMRYYRREKPGILFVTHTGWIAKYLNFNKIYIILDGEIKEGRGAEETLNIILKEGFREIK